MSETRKFAAILVADVVGYSRLAWAAEENPRRADGSARKRSSAEGVDSANKSRDR
jgi:hypothetical protein